MKKKTKIIIEIIRHYIALLLVSIFVLLPYYWMLVTALKPTEEVMQSPATLLPSRLSFTNFFRIWESIPLMTYMKNSLIVSGAVTAIGIVFEIGRAHV